MTAVMFLAFILFLILSFPVAIAMGLSSCVPALIDSSFSADFVYIIRTMVVGIDSTPILAIPLFIISGTMMAQGGISGKLFDVFSYFLGNKTGGLLCATIATCLFYGAISGSGPATCAAVGAMAIPLLVSLGYDKAFCSAMVATAGGLGLIIPPSISFVNYALVTGTSVTSLFMAGILPGCLIGGCLMLYCYIYCRVHGEDKEKIRKNYEQLHRRTIFQVLRSALGFAFPCNYFGRNIQRHLLPHRSSLYFCCICCSGLCLYLPHHFPKATLDSYAGVGPRLRASLCIARSCNCFQPDPDHAQCPTGLGFLPFWYNFQSHFFPYFT